MHISGITVVLAKNKICALFALHAKDQQGSEFFRHGLLGGEHPEDI